MKKKKIIGYISILVLILFAYLLLIRSGNTSFETCITNIWLHKKVQILTIIIITSFYLFILSITNSVWMTSSIFIVLTFTVSIVNFEKVSYRREGILPSDISMLNSINDLLSMVGIKIIFISLFLIAVLICICYFVFRNVSFKLLWKSRVVLFVLMLFSFYGYSNIPKNNIFANKINSITGNNLIYLDPPSAVAINGPVLNYINNSNLSVMTRPRGYSKNKIEKISSKYNKVSLNLNRNRITNKNQKVVFILSESFSDPTRVPGITLNRDPMPFTRNLIKSGVGGNMISDGYGGGTGNMEYQELTGLSLGNFSPTMPTPYTELVVNQKRVFSFNQSYDNSIAIHPYEGTLYSRKKVFHKMKFDKFDYLSNNYPKKYMNKIGSNPYVSDKSTYKYLLNLISGQYRNGNQFFQLSTMQNHMPYDSDYYKNNKFRISGSLKGNEAKKIETYAQGIKYTDSANKYLIDNLKRIKSKVTVVFYGDHLPSIYDNNIVSKHSVLMHETPYFIWTNHGNLKKFNYEKVLGTYSLNSAMLQATDAKVTPYDVLLMKVSEELPIITSKVNAKSSKGDPNLANGGFELLDSSSLKMISKHSLTKKQKKLLKEYQLIQYDLTVGKRYFIDSTRY